MQNEQIIERIVLPYADYDQSPSSNLLPKTNRDHQIAVRTKSPMTTVSAIASALAVTICVSPATSICVVPSAADATLIVKLAVEAIPSQTPRVVFWPSENFTERLKSKHYILLYII